MVVLIALVGLIIVDNDIRFAFIGEFLSLPPLNAVLNGLYYFEVLFQRGGCGVAFGRETG